MKIKAVEKIASELATVQMSQLEIQSKIMEQTAALQTELKKLQDHDKDVRIALQQAMEDNDVKSFENDVIKITYIAPSERVGVDLNKLKVFHPDLAEKYKKITPVKASVRIKVKDQE